MRVNALSKPNYDVIHSRDFHSRDLRLKIKVQKISVQNLEAFEIVFGQKSPFLQVKVIFGHFRTEILELAIFGYFSTENWSFWPFLGNS